MKRVVPDLLDGKSDIAQRFKSVFRNREDTKFTSWNENMFVSRHGVDFGDGDRVDTMFKFD